MIKNQYSKEEKQSILEKIKLIFILILLSDIVMFSFFIFFPVERVNLEYSKEVKKALSESLDSIEVSGVKVKINRFFETSQDLELYIYRNTRYFNELNFYGILELQVKNYKILVGDVQLLRKGTSKNNPTKIIFSGSVIKLDDEFKSQYFKTEKPILRFDINKKITEKYLSEILVKSFENIFSIAKIEYKSNNELKIDKNLNNLSDSLEKIRKEYYYKNLYFWLSLFAFSFVFILIIFSFIYFQNKKYLESK